MMGWYHPIPSRKNGDESSKEAATIAAAPVSNGIRAAVSHAAGLEASPTGRPPAAAQAAAGFAASGLGSGGDDLDGGRFPVGTILGGPRGLRECPLEAGKRRQ